MGVKDFHPVPPDVVAAQIAAVAGDIVDGEADLGTAGAETIVRALEKGLRERDLKALVVRIDSGGGSALASERIRQAVIAAKARGLPVVASMLMEALSGKLREEPRRPLLPALPLELSLC